MPRKFAHILIMLSLLGMLGCKSTEVIAPGNLLDGKILAVVHGCGGFFTYRNTLPPNTVAALDHTLTQSPDGIEFDVQISADGQLVVCHDGLLDLMTTCTGCIHDQNWADLKDCRYQTRNGAWDGIHRLPLADTIMAHIAASGQRPYVFINTKHDSPCDPGDDGASLDIFAATLVDAIHRHDLGDRVIVESMSPSFLDKVAALDDRLLLLFDDENYERGMNIVRAHGFLGLCISNGVVSAEQVAAAHAEGYWLGIWGVKVLGDTRKAVAKGPELVMTDDLLMLRAALKK